MIRTLLMTTALLASTATSAFARDPLTASLPKETAVTLESFYQTQEIVRVRSKFRGSAVFTASSQEIDPRAVLVFEARSESNDGERARWRCVARYDVAECLGDPLKIRYLPGDKRVVLTITTLPSWDKEKIEEGLKLARR